MLFKLQEAKGEEATAAEATAAEGVVVGVMVVVVVVVVMRGCEDARRRRSGCIRNAIKRKSRRVG